MKVIIAGGRDYEFDNTDLLNLYSIKEYYNLEEIVSGGASGADSEGEMFACENNIPVKRFKADWLKYGKSAGPIRNEQMAKYADAVILFQGGRGTENMRKLAIKYGLKILYDSLDTTKILM